MIMAVTSQSYEHCHDDNHNRCISWGLIMMAVTVWWWTLCTYVDGKHGRGTSSDPFWCYVMMAVTVWWWCSQGGHITVTRAFCWKGAFLLMTSTTGAPPPTRSTAWTEETAFQNTGQAILGRGEPLSGFHHHHPQSKSLFWMSSSFYSSRAS